jgi:hypothetical protein
MNRTSRSRRRLVLATVAAMLLGVTAYLSVALAYPKPVASVLGADWQCQRVAFLTTCTRAPQIEPIADRTGKPPIGRRV